MKLPERLQRRLAPLVERSDRFLKNWEWTWTTAVLACLGIAFFTLVFTVFIPSFFLYFADQKLRWRSFWLLKLRDALAAGWITTWFAVILATAYILQERRAKVRGRGGETRPSGGYR